MELLLTRIYKDFSLLLATRIYLDTACIRPPTIWQQFRAYHYAVNRI
jgi:hypothetical protein